MHSVFTEMQSCRSATLEKPWYFEFHYQWDTFPHSLCGYKRKRFEIRLGGRMRIFRGIFQEKNDILRHGTRAMNPFDLPPHFVVGNVHKVAETDENSCSPKLLWIIRTATPKFNEVRGTWSGSGQTARCDYSEGLRTEILFSRWTGQDEQLSDTHDTSSF